MATNIGTAPSFTTGNMKPYAGEQIDAVWGQNLADNTGFLYAREIPLPLERRSTVTNTFIFVKRASHNGVKIMARGQTGTSGAITTYARFYADGQDVSDDTAASLTGTKAYTMTADTTNRFDMDISGLSTGATYYLKYTSSNAGITPNAIGVWLTYGSAATY